MPRKARIVVPNTPHHVMQDCIDGLKIFGDKDDYAEYLNKLVAAAEEFKVEILGYCLLPGRVHLILQPKTEDGLGKAVRQIHSHYTRYHNSKYAMKGNIWGERFASCPVEKSMLDEVCRYVERQPVSPRSKRKIENYDHTSAAEHCSTASSAISSDKWPADKDRRKWSKFINQSPDQQTVDNIEYCTRRGYALGGKAFITRLEKKLGRPVTTQKNR